MGVKRLLFLSIIVLFLATFQASNVYSQEKTLEDAKKKLKVNELPLFDCGLPGVEGKNKCCSIEAINAIRDNLQKDSDVPNFVGIVVKAAKGLGYLPGLGELRKTAQVVEKYTSVIKEIKNTGKDVDPPVCFLGGEQSTPDPRDPDCRCLTPEEAYLRDKKAIVSKIGDLCNRYTDSSENSKCTKCLLDGGYYSAVGCIYFQPERFIFFNVFGLGLRLAGLYVFLCIIYSAIQIQFARGNPEKIKSEKERITSCIIGLLVIIFSVFILKIVGVNILGIPFLD